MTDLHMAKSGPDIRARAPWRLRVVLLVGVVAIPIVLTLAFNSYGPLTAQSAWQMAAAAVAGQTIAAATAVGVVALAIRHTRSATAICVSLLIAVVVIVAAFATINTAGSLLLDRRERVAEVELLNG